MSNNSGEPAALQEKLLTSDAFLFDIDGTLLNTRDLVHWDALHQAMLEGYGVDTTIEGIAYHGMTDVGILRAALSRHGIEPAEFERGLSRALNIVRREVHCRQERIVCEVCPGVKELLVFLCKRQKLLAVASGNLESVGWCKIKAAGLAEFFRFGFFSDQCESRKGIFRKAINNVRSLIGSESRVTFLGDTPSDISAARGTGAAIIAIATGSFSQEQLLSYQPDLCVATCSDLLTAVWPK